MAENDNPRYAVLSAAANTAIIVSSVVHSPSQDSIVELHPLGDTSGKTAQVPLSGFYKRLVISIGVVCGNLSSNRDYTWIRVASANVLATKHHFNRRLWVENRIRLRDRIVHQQANMMAIWFSVWLSVFADSCDVSP
jgi:hypothetical protein